MTTEVNYSKEFIQSILAYFSYVNMDGSSDKDIRWSDFRGKDLTLEIYKKDFIDNFNKYLGNKYDSDYALNEYKNTEFILNFFTDNFIIKEQLVTRGFDGFSAVTYELKKDLLDYGFNSGDTFVVYRGTEAGQVGDMVTDFNLTFSDKTGDHVIQRTINEFLDRMSQETHGVVYLEETINKLNKNPDGTMAYIPKRVYVVGHSLGGYLSVRSLLSLEEKYGIKYVLDYVESVSTFNGAGLAVTDGWLTGKDSLAMIVKNFYSYRGINVTAGNFFDMFAGTGTVVSLFEHLGPRYGTATEAPGGMENHSMSLLMNSFGFFATLEYLIEGYPDKVTDIYDQKLTGEDAKLYLINQLIMNGSYVENDFGKSLSTIAQKIIEGFGLNLDYSSSIATFIGLREYFIEHPELKISLYDNFSNIGLSDSNSNRSSFYSLMNDLSYVLIVPESYNEGIFKRDGNSEFYNVSHYSQDYLNKRIIYNKAVTELMERKLMQVLPYYIDMDGVGKYAFVVETTLYGDKFLGGSAYQSTIFINANEADAENGTVKYIYMKSDQNKLLNVFKDGSIVFDTALDDSLVIYSNNNTIHSMNGTDHIRFGLHYKDNSHLIGNKVIITEKTDIVYIQNSSTNLNSLTIDFENSTSGLSVNAMGLSSNFERNRVIIKNGNQTIEVDGVFKLNLNGHIVEYKDIYSTIANFPEMFMDGFFNINTVVNQSFIDSYMDLVKDRFNDGFIVPENKISEKLADYIIARLKQYTLDSSINTLSIQNNIKDKIHVSELKTTFHPEIQDVINQTVVVIEGISIKDFVYSKLNNFADSKYNSLNEMTKEDNNEHNGVSREAFDGMYYQKGTKNYDEWVDSENRTHYEWDGQYYYDRVDANGDKIAAFYGDYKTAGIGYKKYLKEDLYIKGDVDSHGFHYDNISGSDGSDILIGNKVDGQSLYYFENENVLDGDAQLRDNGNDILIGSNVSAYSGNNLIISNGFFGVLKGGRGNDVIIAKESATIIADQNENIIEDITNENTLLLLNRGTVFSSNGKNTIYANNGDVFATGNDTIYMNGGTFYGYQLTSENTGYGNQQHELLSFFDETGFSFYSKYKINENVNTIYDYGGLTAYLKKYDIINSTESEIQEASKIYGLGNNIYEINGNGRTIYSGGDSLVSINGSFNKIYLETNDTYKIIYSAKNSFYARGLNNNTENLIGSDNYTITGLRNDLYIGNTTYDLNLNGHETSLIYTKNNTESQKIKINETGITNILIDEYYVNKIGIDSRNDFQIKGGKNFGHINSLDIHAKVGFIKNSNNIALNDLIIGNFIIKSDDLIGLSVDSMLKQVFIENVNLIGVINKNEIFNFNGYIENLSIYGDEAQKSKINIDGYIDNLIVSNADSFKYVKSFNKDLTSNISINSSSLQNISGMSDYNYVNLSLNTSTIQEIVLNNINSSKLNFSGSFIKELTLNNITASEVSSYSGSINKLSINKLKGSNLTLTVDNINEVYISKYESSSFNIGGNSNNLKTNINGLIISGINLNNFYISKTFMPPIDTNINFSLNNFDSIDIQLNHETELQLSNSNGTVSIHNGLLAGTLANLNILNLSNITVIYASIRDVNTVNLDIDSLTDIPLFNDLNNINNLNLITNNEIIITKSMIGDFMFGSSYTGNYTLRVGNNYLTKNEIEEIRNSLIEYTAYAIIKTAGIEYVHPEITEPEFPYMDENNIYQGTSKNDVFDLNDSSKPYTLNGKGGDDIFNFNSYQYMQNTINYKDSDGFDTVNVNQYVTLKLNLDTISVSNLSFTVENNPYGMPTVLNIFKNGVQIFKLNNYEKMNLTLQTLERTYQSHEITKLMRSMYGTVGDDVINGTDKDNYIYAGKGDDVINLKGFYNNEVYYNKGDGHDTVNSPNTRYTVVFENTIDINNVTYESIGTNSFNVLFGSEIIMTINEADKANLQYLSNYQTITGLSVLEELSAITGSDNADVINVDTATTVKAKGGDDIINVNNNQAKIYAGTGNDIININYTNLNQESTVYYEKDDGMTTVNLLKDVYNQVNIQLKNMSASQLKYEYSVENHNTLNIYYSSSTFPPNYSKIMVIENYRRVFSETYTTGRAYLNVGGQPINHNTIDTQAESNYNSAMSAANLMNTSMSDMNVMIETMASNETIEDTSVNNQSLSSILKKDE